MTKIPIEKENFDSRWLIQMKLLPIILQIIVIHIVIIIICYYRHQDERWSDACLISYT